MMDEDAGVALRKRRRTIDCQKPDRQTIGVAGWLIACRKPVGVSAVPAREEAERWRRVAVVRQDRRRRHKQRYDQDRSGSSSTGPRCSLDLHFTPPMLLIRFSKPNQFERERCASRRVPVFV